MHVKVHEKHTYAGKGVNELLGPHLVLLQCKYQD